ncbi:hypothetical protein C8R45DRAFT_1081615 [Mycena sanguinolenta]|nr:hypothetical protein C8R45DRAFT_1081615 [Mycena sanguinolenta]
MIRFDMFYGGNEPTSIINNISGGTGGHGGRGGIYGGGGGQGQGPTMNFGGVQNLTNNILSKVRQILAIRASGDVCNFLNPPSRELQMSPGNSAWHFQRTKKK